MRALNCARVVLNPVAPVARRTGLTLLVMATVSVAAARGTQDAVANGDTRTLTIYHAHTKESLTVTYRRNGQYDERALEQLNWLLRDWRRDEPTRMDPRLFDTLWTVYRETGSDEAIHVVSAYRSPQTNSMLRRRSGAVAEHSQHMLGKAMDFYLPDVSVDRIRAIGMRLQNGGVGYYPSSYTPFIHLDVGSVRAWPRMTRDQLVRLFPDGRTVHLPADGNPLPGYEEARAEVLARGGKVAGVTAVADAGEAPAPRRRGFWATLFGIDEDEDAQEISQMQTARARPRTDPVTTASLGPGDDSSASAFLQSFSRRTQVAQRASQPSPEPVPAPVPAPAPQPLPRFDDPPPARVASLAADPSGGTGPRLAWQGPGSAAEDLPPIPPRRPADLPGALAFAPTPTLRRDGPAPGETPVSSGAALIALTHPLPPPRPTARPIQVASAGLIVLPVPAPAALPARGPASTSAKARRDASAEDRASTRPRPRSSTGPSAPIPSRVPIKAAQVKTRGAPTGTSLSAGPALQSGFSSKPTGDLTTGRFAGPAVKVVSR
jgi:uncharacterized protein YcbK (DUF882 family)